MWTSIHLNRGRDVTFAFHFCDFTAMDGASGHLGAAFGAFHFGGEFGVQVAFGAFHLVAGVVGAAFVVEFAFGAEEFDRNRFWIGPVHFRFSHWVGVVVQFLGVL